MSGISATQRPIADPLLRLVLTPVFTALALATDYALTGIPNVKLMDSLVFIAAFLFGIEVGAGVAVLTWTIYGFFNPYGQAGFPLILFLMAGECFYAVAGGILRRTSLAKDLLVAKRGLVKFSILSGLVFGFAGFLATFGYDALTNFATYLPFASSPYEAFIIGMVTGAPFALIHEGSNVIFFAIAAPGVIVASKDLAQRGGR